VRYELFRIRTATEGSEMEVDALLDTSTLAAHIGIPERTIDQWAYLGKGPAFIKVGRHRRYRQRDVDAWLERNRHGGDAA
jgi:excisionase family DNA binding protein